LKPPRPRRLAWQAPSIMVLPAETAGSAPSLRHPTPPGCPFPEVSARSYRSRGSQPVQLGRGDDGRHRRSRSCAERVFGGSCPRVWGNGSIRTSLLPGSFSNNNLHSRGSFRGWEGVCSTGRFLYTHRGGKWATFLLRRSPRRATPVLRPLPRTPPASDPSCLTAATARGLRPAATGSV